MRRGEAGDLIRNLHVDLVLPRPDQRRGPAVEQNLRLRKQGIENPVGAEGSEY